MELSYGHRLTFRLPDGSRRHFQNFWIGETVTIDTQECSFLPFGFSGVSVSRQGDNIEASLLFPNNDLSRPWITEAVDNHWIAVVRVLILNPTNRADYTILHRYLGQVAGGGWDDTAVTLRLNTVLDAVGGEIPARTIHQKLVGALPHTAAVGF
jgi:hypothetical protein